jgi:hypothetical protein
LYIVVLYYTSVLYNTGVLCYTWVIAWIDSGHYMKAVTFIIVSTEECKSMDNILKVRDVKPVKGTFKLHVVAGIGKSEVFVRETSCYCNICQ